MRRIGMTSVLAWIASLCFGQTLQQVTDHGAITNQPITANSFVANVNSFAGYGVLSNISSLSGLSMHGNIGDAAHNGISFTSGGGGGAALGFYRGGSYDTGIDFYTNHDINSSGSMVHRMRLNSQGYLGIGTTNPQQQLDVHGVIRWGEPTNYTYAGQDAIGGYIEQVGHSVAQNRIRLQTAKLGDFSSYAQLFIDAQNGFSFMTTGTGNGNVGIGTTTPQEKLSVNGKIRAKEIKVETANWPDYVFEEGYQIGTLEALENYIKKNKRLPEIPSAQEVETKGIALGEMNKLLLKKVEELTLLLIEQNKLREADAKRITTLERKIK